MDFFNLNPSVLQIVPGINSSAKRSNGPWCNKLNTVYA
jgi:hypothetical protein